MMSSSLALVVAIKTHQEENLLDNVEQTKTLLHFNLDQRLMKTWDQNAIEKDWRTMTDINESVMIDLNGRREEEEEEKELMKKIKDKRTVEVEKRERQEDLIEDQMVQLIQYNEENEGKRRQHCFINIMKPSWLLASIEERCAERTIRSFMTQSVRNERELNLVQQLVDVRFALMDCCFIYQSGVEVNLLGRPPSSVDTHYRNVISRLREIKAAKEDGIECSSVDIQRVTRIFESLKSDMFMPAVRCLGWLLTKMWRLLFYGLHVDLESLDHVRRVLEVSEGDVSVVFAPTHKSHLDYLIISYLCFAYGIPLPRIAAGNNLDLPLVGSFLRANGSFFIRRSLQNDRLYKEVLEQYVHELLRDGNPVEVFIEGGRSRHGRVCKPRLGFMSMFLNYVKGTPHVAYNDDAVEKKEEAKKTILVVPISLDYDKVYEVDGYANQLLGKPKEKESLVVLFRSVWDLFFLRLGHAYVRFGKPVSLTKTSTLHDSSELVAERMQNSGTITSTAIMSALLMWKRAYVTEKMLETRIVWLAEELEKRGATVAHMENENMVAHALLILKVDMKANRVVVPQLQHPVRALELGFYRNHLLHVFLPDMAVIGALDAALRQHARCDEPYLTQYKVNIWAVQQQAKKIWRFLRHICRHEAVDIEARLARFLADTSACDVDASSGTVTIDVNRWNAAKLTSFVLSLHWSFMDSLWLTTQGLWCLLSTKEGDDIERTECDMVRRVQILAKELFMCQELFHAEALCMESIKQSLDFLVESGVVRYERLHDGKSRLVRLCLNDIESTRVLNDFTREINACRKPRSFLWRQDERPRNLTREEALKFMENAQSSQSIYAKWMAPPSGDCH
ncbi:unnamed protein product [Peronospora belbahrii]|uniref:Phospholipid/glycerol acyltransferase domain-containing protein n=1 Tax=Peronospora belbahrii TaxID=622444 RepID=A0ABN8D8E0_9STRA|nr:unnamed protein product [Peronospora belbahrii]